MQTEGEKCFLGGDVAGSGNRQKGLRTLGEDMWRGEDGQQLKRMDLNRGAWKVANFIHKKRPYRKQLKKMGRVEAYDRHSCRLFSHVMALHKMKFGPKGTFRSFHRPIMCQEQIF